jgi:beta-aspartyl-peptidase (threonine type)
MEPSLILHGGAGRWDPDEAEAALPGLRAAAAIGQDLLSRGASAMDAVVAAVVALEDDPLFNAGTGSALNLAGEAEMDACVMDGRNLAAGAVGAIKGVRNPVLVARRVMEATGHVLLVGEGAGRFARAVGFPPYDPVTPRRRADHLEKLEALVREGPGEQGTLRGLLEKYPGLACGTVGAVALDRQGALAAATSTGGLTLKLSGRVGDTPIPGAGTYATSAAAASATGHGETILRLLASRHACDRVSGGATAQEASDEAIAALAPYGGEAGIIVVDATGRIGVAHDTDFMPHAHCGAGGAGITARTRMVR